MLLTPVFHDNAGANSGITEIVNIGNMKTISDTYTTIKFGTSEGHLYLNRYNLSALPTNATVISVKVTAKIKASSTANTHYIFCTRELNSSSSSASNVNDGLHIPFACNGVEETVALPLSSVWTLSKLRNGGLGIGLSFAGTASNSYVDIYYIYLTVEYKPPKTYVMFDTIFSYQKWKDNGITAASNATISNITDTGFSITAGAGTEGYTAESPIFPLINGINKYVVEADITGSGSEIFMFPRTSSSAGWSQILSTPSKKGTFTFASNDTVFDIRCDSNNGGQTVTYNNFRIYPEGYEYMSTTVAADKRYNCNTWSFPPNPTRDYKTFVGWNTKIDGTGTYYTSSSPFPTSDTVLYSIWKAEEKKVSAISSPSDSGTFTGIGKYDLGATAKITAVPNAGYSFLRWSDGVKTATRSIKVESDVTLTAIFEPKTYLINFDNNSDQYYEPKEVQYTKNFGSLPKPSKSGYEFCGWYTKNPIVNNLECFGKNYESLTLSEYKFTDKISIHLEAWMDDWSKLSEGGQQLISCTQSGGWGIGDFASGGTEMHFIKSDGNGTYINMSFDFGNLSKGWHSFDTVFANSTLYGYVDGVLKGAKTTPNPEIHYSDSVKIFVGAEAGSNYAVDGRIFNGIITNLFIEHSGDKFNYVTESDVLNTPNNITLYALWKKSDSIFYLGGHPMDIYIGNKMITEAYRGNKRIL